MLPHTEQWKGFLASCYILFYQLKMFFSTLRLSCVKAFSSRSLFTGWKESLSMRTGRGLRTFSSSVFFHVGKLRPREGRGTRQGTQATPEQGLGPALYGFRPPDLR